MATFESAFKVIAFEFEENMATLSDNDEQPKLVLDSVSHDFSKLLGERVGKTEGQKNRPDSPP